MTQFGLYSLLCECWIFNVQCLLQLYVRRKPRAVWWRKKRKKATATICL